jgi:predicted DNA-binding transcriptional regulator YafY
MPRLHRILRILRLLQGEQSYSAGQLALECQISRRTLFRDLQAIEDAGFTVWYDRQVGGYQIHQRSFLPPVNLTISEASELFVAASLLDERQGIPLLHDGRDTLSKLEACLPLDTRLRVLQRTHTTVVHLGPTIRNSTLQPVYDLIQSAIEHGFTLRCHYTSPGDSIPLALHVDPYWLLFHRHAWYVIGHSDYHDRLYTFRLNRLTDVTQTGQTFARPDTCDLADYLGNAWGVMPGDRSYHIQLRFGPAVATEVAEIQWHKTQHLIPQDDGAVLFSATVDGLDEVAWWVHGFGTHVKVLEPEALRLRVAEMASPEDSSIAIQLLGT